ncbi:helix-turn-helix domain-containing protein [Enterococcus hirae]|uniref:helix-turn-helix domain-containing protein n=1 Tax=Enterococcus hirae TaxID=1354 RepID=UPI0032E419D2
MEYGQLIRKIRLDKGFSQKEIYSGIVTKSYCIEFEKGNHDLSFRLLAQVLERLLVDVEEFIFLYDYYHSSSQNLWKQYELASNTKDLEKLFEIYQTTTTSKDKKSQLLNALTKIGHDQLSDHQINNETLEFLVDYLKSIETWTLQEIKIYTNTLNYFSEEQQQIFYKNSLKKIQIYQEYPAGKKIYLTLLLNSCGHFISYGNFFLAKDALSHLKELTTGTEDAIFKLYRIYFENILIYCTEEKSTSETMIHFIIETLDKLDYSVLSEQCTLFFQTIKNNY